MCKKVYDYCRGIYDQKQWWSKLLALVVVVCYFVAVVLVHNQPYLWLTLTFAVVLCLTTLACSRDDPVIAFRRGGPALRPPTYDEQREQPPPLEIWVTDVPPTYSFVMGNSTPPPSYGSAILKFPAAAGDIFEKGDGLNNETPMLRRVLDPNRFRSVSRQVSEIGRLSRQVSESGIAKGSREPSINASELGDGGEDWESGIVIIVPPRPRRTLSQNSESYCFGQAEGEDAEQCPAQVTSTEQEPHQELLQDATPQPTPPTVFTCKVDGAPRTVIVVNVTRYDASPTEEAAPADNNKADDDCGNDSSHDDQKS